MSQKENLPISISVKGRAIIFIVLSLIFAITIFALSNQYQHPQDRIMNHVEDRKQIEKSFFVSSGGNLVVEAELGEIEVTGSEDEKVVVRVTTEGSKENLERFKISLAQEGNSVKVEAHRKWSIFHFFDFGWMEIHFDIKVPKHFNLHLKTAGGNICVYDIKGEIHGETSGGNLKLINLEGEGKTSTSGGDITIINATGDYRSVTSGGDIKGESLSGSISMETSGGNINVWGSDCKLIASTSGGDIQVGLRRNQGIDLSTSGGDINVELPENIRADIDAEASGGVVRCDFTYLGKSSEGMLHGRIGGGGKLIRLETSGGDIKLHSIE